MADIWPIFTSVLGVFLVMAIGGGCRLSHWLTRQADRSLANVATNILLPAYFADRIIRGETFAAGPGGVSWTSPALGFAVTAIGFAVAYLFARSFGPKVGLDTASKQRSFGLCAGICNYGYIPLPLAEKFYPDAVIDLILYTVGVELALWTIGIAIISGTGHGNWKRALRSIPFLAVVAATVVRQFATVDDLPTPLVTALGALGGCAIPMGLLLSGAIIVDFMRQLDWRDSPAVVASAIALRQILLPLLTLAACAVFLPHGDMRQVMILQASMPAAVFPIVLVRLYEQDISTALRVVLGTSLAGLLTIPIWLAVGQWWLGP